jgi:hypothetical protein
MALAIAPIAAGCSSNDDGAAPGSNLLAANAPEDTPDTAPTQAAPAGVDKDERVVRYWGPRPPALHWEDRGAAPSARHFWAPGYWRWNGRDHVWHPGGWFLRREGLEYVPTHWEEHRGRWHYVPAYWAVRR